MITIRQLFEIRDLTLAEKLAAAGNPPTMIELETMGGTTYRHTLIEAAFNGAAGNYVDWVSIDSERVETSAQAEGPSQPVAECGLLFNNICHPLDTPPAEGGKCC